MKRGSRLDVPCRIYRGGTSRGLYFLDRDLPPSRDVRERILLCAMGSPDARQIDGLGGANSQTSKAMIVGPPDDSETNADVAMLFAQVGIERPLVDWGGNCGNLTSAVGVFAIDAGLVEAEEPETIVRIHSRNTGLRVHAHIPVRDGGLVRDGDYEIPGVPGSAARIDLEWLDPGGSSGRGLLPTGEPSEEIVLPSGRAVEVSIVDAANPVVFCDAAAVGLEGCELPPAIEANEEATSSLETIRKEAGKRTGLTPSPVVPKVALVARPRATRRAVA